MRHGKRGGMSDDHYMTIVWTCGGLVLMLIYFAAAGWF